MGFEEELEKIKNCDIKLRLELFNIKNKLNPNSLSKEDYDCIIKCYNRMNYQFNILRNNIEIIYNKSNYQLYDKNQKLIDIKKN